MKKSFYFIILVFLHLFILGNLQFTAWPEMLSYPYLVNHGFKLYSDIIHPYPPGLTIILSILFKAAHQENYIYLIKGFTWTLIILNDLLIYKIVKRLTQKNLFAYFAVALYILTQPFLEGNMLWFDGALVTPVLMGIYYLVNKQNTKNILLAGLFFATSVFIKQTSGLLFLVAMFYVLYKQKNIKSVIYFLVPAFILGIIFLVWSISTNQLIDFLNWNLVYPFTFWSKFPGYVQMSLTKGQTLVTLFLISPIVILGLLKRKILNNSTFVFLGVLLLTSFIMVYPRFSFFHFQLALSLIVILFGYLLSQMKTKQSITLFSVYILIITLFISRPIVIRDWNKPTRFWEDAIKLGQNINELNKSNEKIYLLGVSSDVYVSSNTLPAKPWPDNYGWYLEIPDMQEKILSRWQEDPPYYIYRQTPEAGNWYDLGTYQPQKITDWITKNYELKDNLRDNIDIWQKRN